MDGFPSLLFLLLETSQLMLPPFKDDPSSAAIARFTSSSLVYPIAPVPTLPCLPLYTSAHWGFDSVFACFMSSSQVTPSGIPPTHMVFSWLMKVFLSEFQE